MHVSDASVNATPVDAASDLSQVAPTPDPNRHQDLFAALRAERREYHRHRGQNDDKPDYLHIEPRLRPTPR